MSAEIERLPRRKAEAEAPAALSPERAALAAAIERVAGIETQIRRIDAAIEALGFYGHDGLIDTFDRAEATLAEAHHRQGATADVLVGRLLGETVDDPIPALQAARDEAAHKLDQARTDRQLLKDEKRRLDARLTAARNELWQPISAVLRAEPAVRALFEEHARLQAALLACRTRLRALGPIEPPAGMSDWRVVNLEMMRDLRVGLRDESWAAAIARLETDASAPLPSP